jgi:FSR family fosmidomycin resistance protein-like MFS transporter
MYHPEAAARVHENAGADVGRSMSMFVLCGSIGFTTGAMIFGPLLSFWGLAGTYALILPGLAMPGVLLCLTRRAGTGTTHGVPSHITGAQIARRMSLPVLVMAMRQWVTVGLISLTPLYYVTYLHNTPATGAAMLFALQLGSNLGIFACGVLGKKLGYKRMVVAGLLAAVPPLFLFPHATGLLAALLLCLGGAALAPSMPGLTVIGQELLPGRQALAASLIMGLGVGVGGVASGVLGLIADHAGLPCTLVLLALMPLVSGLLACALPRPELALRKLAP